MKKIYLGLIIILMSAFVMNGCGKKDTSEPSSDIISDTDADAPSVLYSENPIISIEIENYGEITVELDPSSAPITVENFLNLVNEGFYDGLTFHRIISGFMIQGGDPIGDGSGGSENKIKGEFKKNNVDNPLEHTRGTISMARAKPFDSASSQFFIIHEDSLYLDGEYAAFGWVLTGMEVVDQICEEVPQGINGSVAKEDQPVITSIKVVTE